VARSGSVFPRSANVPVDFEEILVSGLISDKATVQEAVTSIKRNGVGLKGEPV